MVHRFGLGVLILFIGTVIFFSGIWNIFLDALIDRTIGSIAIIGDFYNAVAPNDTSTQMILILIGFILMATGVFIAKSHVRKQGLIS